jgi:hypothetical protein
MSKKKRGDDENRQEKRGENFNKKKPFDMIPYRFECF